MKYMPILQHEAEQFRKEYSRELDVMNLRGLVLELFSYLDHEDESDSGNVFHPVTVSSCRVLLTEPVGMVLKRLRELATGAIAQTNKEVA